MKRIRRSVTDQEYQKLITHTKSDPGIKEHKRLKLLRIFTLLYYTGMRINEVSLIKIEKIHELIDQSKGIIDTPKKENERELHFSPAACKSIKLLIKDAAPEENFIYAWEKKTTPMHKISLIAMVNTYMKQVLGQGYTSHSFRQGIITDMFAAGLSTPMVQKFIGHSDPKTTLHYAAPTSAQVHNALIR